MSEYTTHFHAPPRWGRDISASIYLHVRACLITITTNTSTPKCTQDSPADATPVGDEGMAILRSRTVQRGVRANVVLH